MIRLVIFAACLAAALPLRAQEGDGERDRPLEEMEAKLQEQRATAVRSRLVLYSDELEKLHAQFTTSGDTAAAGAVKTELDAVQAAMRQLAGIARRQADPPAPEELQKGEELSAAALAARRINKIVERYSTAGKTPGRPAAGLATAAVRQRILKFDKAVRNNDYLDSGPRAYWGYDSAYALWSVPDLQPGEYEVIFRYNADGDTGGKAIVKVAGAKFEVTVPAGVKGAKEQRLTAGTVTVKEAGVDVRVENGGLTKRAQSLWNLEAVILQPVVKNP